MKLKYKKINFNRYESHWLVLNEIRPKSKVLDLGCATGYIAKELQKKDCMVWGVEINKGASKIAKKYLEDIYNGDLRYVDKFKLKKNSFDYILLLDVAEHIVDIEPVLIKIKKYLKNEGKLIISTPNIAHIKPRLSLLFGQFEYTETGIMDNTHIHFYTKKTLFKLLNKVGYNVEKFNYSADFGQIPIFDRLLKNLPKGLQYNITKSLPSLLAVQFIVVCHNI